MNRRKFISGVIGTSIAGSRLAAAAMTREESVQQVLVMFKCHLDVGFIDTQAAVIHKYFSRFYPQAIAIAQQMRRESPDGRPQYVWTTGSWLLYRYLEQASKEDRKRMEQAIAEGNIAWHALPFTWQTELLDRSAIAGCLGFSKVLDSRFGRRTTGAKMTDVPGHSRGLIRPLSEGGVRFLNIGVNSASTPPDVPDLFIWKDPDGHKLIVMYHRKAYGGIVIVPSSKLAVAVEVRDDNSGPHTPAEIRKIRDELRARFPNATIQPSDLTAIANAVQPYEHALPVVTEEIGDTWIYGVPSDPLKVARFRELLRLRRRWIESRNFQTGDNTDLTLLQNAALAAEHTWGTDTKTWLDFDHYTPKALRAMLARPNYRTVTSSWAEKRGDIDAGIASLPSKLRSEAVESFTRLSPVSPKTAGLQTTDAQLEGEYFAVGLDRATGAITRLIDQKTKRDWASPDHPLALFTYQTLSQADYDRFLKSYITVQTDWAPKDFGKPNIQHFGAKSRTFHTKLLSAYTPQSHSAQKLIAKLGIDGPANDDATGYPRELWLTLTLPKDEPVLKITFAWFGKEANRLPEALWLTFQPIAPAKDGWALNKVEQTVSPLDVVPGGNKTMHAVWDTVNYRDGQGGIAIETVDAPVVSLGVRSPIFFSKNQPDIANGLHFSLFNNGWGTNYIQWFGEDMQFRFEIRTSGKNS